MSPSKSSTKVRGKGFSGTRVSPLPRWRLAFLAATLAALRSALSRALRATHGPGNDGCQDPYRKQQRHDLREKQSVFSEKKSHVDSLLINQQR